MDKIFIYLADSLKNGDYFFLGVTLVILICYCIFNSFRKTFINEKEKDITFLNESLKYHTLAIFALKSYLSKDIKENSLDSITEIKTLNTALENLVFYSQPNALSVIYKWLESNNTEQLNELYLLFTEEIKNIKEQQMFPNKKHSIDSSLYEFGYFLKKNHFDALVIPFIYAISFIIGVLMILLLILPSINNSNSLFRFFYITIVITFVSSILVALFTLDLLLHNKLKKKKTIVIFTCTYFISMFLFFLGINYFNIIWFFFSWIYIIFIIIKINNN